MQLSSSPVIRRPREEEAFSLEHVNRSGESSIVALLDLLLLVLSMMELGTPRGKETTTGSYSGLLGDTSTLMEVLRLFLRDDCLDGDDEDETLSALRFLEIDVDVGAIICLGCISSFRLFLVYVRSC